MKKLLSTILISVAITGCTEWADHYEEGPAQGSGLTVMQLLEQDDATKAFAGLISKSGYADLLSSSQSFTVFAPPADAMGPDANADMASIRRMVSNHIARQTYPSSTPVTTSVRMLNGKIYYFNSSDMFGGCTMAQHDIKATNGLVHKLSNAQIPYANNIYEHIEASSEMSALYEFIHSFDEVRFDPDASTEIDIDDNGRPVFDSVMVSYNRLLEDKAYGIGHIKSEDSLYSMVVPTNEAWAAAYERIAPSFKVYDTNAHVADSIQDIRTKLAIVNDLVYRGSIAGADSIVSTTGSVIHSPADLISGTQELSASNGMLFTATTLNYDNSETWNKPISVEAEQQNGRTYNNTLTSVYMRNVTAASIVSGVSGDSYIEVMPISTSTNPTVIFDIPNTLAGKYNVYAVFLPATVEGPTTELDSTRITFTVAYMNSNGRSTSKRNNSRTLLTSGSKPVKMLAFEELELPVSNTTDRLWLMDKTNDPSMLPVTTQLTVATNVTSREFSSGELSRTFRLDRIIFEPVKK